jgi:riboflavin biosynthesis pyrimidine reductase
MRWLLDGGHGWPHDDLPTWLLSHDAGLAQRIGATRTPLLRCEGAIADVFDSIADAGHARVWLCGGGDIAGQALAADRIDTVIVTVAPTVLGSGPALFDGVDLPARAFQLTEYARLGTAVQLTWVRAR